MAYDKVVDSAKLEAGLTSIANAIRDHAGDPGPSRVCKFPDGFVTGITDVYDVGVESGRNEMMDVAQAEYENGVAAGEQGEWSRFWDALQGNGNRRNYNYAFYGSNWKDENFRPKYDIVPTECERILYKAAVTDLAKILETCGVTLDTSQSTKFHYAFNGSQITHLPTISTVKASKLSYTFYDMQSLTTIDTLILKDDGSQTFEYTFWCNDLVDLTIAGTIGNDFSVTNCHRLSKASITSIVNALSSTATGKKLTLKKTAVTSAFGSTTAAEWTTLANSKQNWTIALSN